MQKNILTSLLLSLSCYAVAAQGLWPDPSFGGSPAGCAIFTSIPSGSFEQGIARQADGQVLVTSGTSSGMARLNAADGTIDNSFGGGWVSAGNFSFGEIIPLTGGGVLATGRPTDISHSDLYIWRYKGDGTPDNSFGINGRVGDSSIGAGYEHIAIQSGNKIIWSGSGGLKRLNLADGSLDATFGTGGFVRLSQLPLVPLDMTVDAVTGNIIIAGLNKTTQAIAVARLTPNGSLDAGFGTGGSTNLTQKATGLSTFIKVAMRSGSKIILVSDYDKGSSNDVLCAGFNANGTVDNSFGTSGVTLPDWGITSGIAYAGGLAINANDSVFIASTLTDSAGSPMNADVAVQKLSPSGIIDAVFGTAKLDINHTSQGVQAMALQTDGKLLINGYSAGKELVARFTTPPNGLVHTALVPEATLYPNPATETLTITNANDAAYRITDVTSRQLAAGRISKTQNTIDVSKYAAGVYFIGVMKDGSTKVLKFSKE